MNENPTPHRWLVVPFLPLVLAAIFCFWARPQGISTVAPLLGPWAGAAYGYPESTMTRVAPAATWVAIGLGVLALVSALLRRKLRSDVWFLLSSLWSCAWGGLAVCWILNTLE